jgi:hypothetical protein
VISLKCQSDRAIGCLSFRCYLDADAEEATKAGSAAPEEVGCITLPRTPLSTIGLLVIMGMLTAHALNA